MIKQEKACTASPQSVASNTRCNPPITLGNIVNALAAKKMGVTIADIRADKKLKKVYADQVGIVHAEVKPVFCSCFQSELEKEHAGKSSLDSKQRKQLEKNAEASCMEKVKVHFD